MKSLIFIIFCLLPVVAAAQPTSQDSITAEALELLEQSINDCDETIKELEKKIFELNQLSIEKTQIINRTLLSIEASTKAIEESRHKERQATAKADRKKNILVGFGSVLTGFIIGQNIQK